MDECKTMNDFDEIAAAREIVEILCSGLDPFHKQGFLMERFRVAEALESIPPEKLQLLLKLMREKDDG